MRALITRHHNSDRLQARRWLVALVSLSVLSASVPADLTARSQQASSAQRASASKDNPRKDATTSSQDAKKPAPRDAKDAPAQDAKKNAAQDPKASEKTSEESEKSESQDAKAKASDAAAKPKPRFTSEDMQPELPAPIPSHTPANADASKAKPRFTAEDMQPEIPAAQQKPVTPDATKAKPRFTAEDMQPEVPVQQKPVTPDATKAKPRFTAEDMQPETTPAQKPMDPAAAKPRFTAEDMKPEPPAQQKPIDLSAPSAKPRFTAEDMKPEPPAQEKPVDPAAAKPRFTADDMGTELPQLPPKPRFTDEDAGGGIITAAALRVSYSAGMPVCQQCHEKQTVAYLKGPHGAKWDRRAPAAKDACETCHGPAEIHAIAPPTKGAVINFKKLTPREASERCMTCHSKKNHVNWQGSMHDARNITCVNCHSVHNPKSERGHLKEASVIATCASCHRTEAAKMKRSSHMPVREGKMDCASCHNEHGSSNVKLLRAGNTVNESCNSCHTEKRGPFLFEHAPVRENCATCHDPHGSSGDRLLNANGSMLCQRCHTATPSIATGHPGTPLDGARVTSKSNRLMNRGCVNCHSMIHGSNSPSGQFFHR